MAKTFVYTGTWTVQAAGKRGGGIGMYRYEAETGAVQYLGCACPELVAGMLCVDEKRGVLYAVDEAVNHPRFGGQGGGGRVLAFAIEPQTGALRLLNEQPTFGTLPAYLALDGSGGKLVACNHSNNDTVTDYERGTDGRYTLKTRYSPVTAVLYPLAEDGRIGPAEDIAAFGAEYNVCPPRNACLHCICFAHDGKHFLLCNMKQNEVLLYEAGEGGLRLCSRLACPPGSYPHYAVLNREK